MIHSLSLDNFYLTEEQLENSPSRQDGIDKDTEANLRMYGCELIQEAGIMLGFRQVVMATGQVLLHRFFCKRSMKNFNVKKVAATALWMGAKLEEVVVVREHPKKLQDMVMMAVDRCIARRETTDGRKLPVLDAYHSKEGEEFRRSLIRYENEMLRAFGFIMNVEHPHRLLCSCCQILFLPYMKEQDKWDFLTGFIQQAWNVANDSLRTTLCVRFKGSVVACGIIFYTARKLKVPLPDCWWEVFAVKLEDLCEVCRILHELYLAPKSTFIPVCHQLLPSKPPAPALAGGVATLRGAVSATPTPMLGATPQLSTRPGGKPLDPSIRRTLPASEFTPAVGGSGAGAAANGASLQSPEGAPAPGSARKRSRSRSPQPSGEEGRKRQQLGTQPGQSSAASGREQQLHQQAWDAMAAAAASLSRPGSAGGDRDRDRDRSRDLRRPDRAPDKDRGSERGPCRDRPRSRSRDRRRSRSRDKGRRSRSRDRRRSRSRSRDRKRSRSREHRRSRSRSRDRERDRRRDHRDSRDRSSKDKSERDRHTERDRHGKGRGEQRTPTKRDKQPKQQQQQQQPAQEGELVFPAPPEPSADSSPAQLPAATGKAQTAAAQDGASKQKQQRDGAANGLGSDHSKEQGREASPLSAAADAARDSSGLPPVQPKPRPKAVRKQQPADGAADATSPGKSPTAQEGHARSSAEHSAD